MSLIRPFAGLRPGPSFAAAVVAPPYDVLSSAEARALAADKPWSFLHISRPEIDLAPSVSPYDASVYAKGAENFRRMLDAGVLRRDSTACYYLYRLTMGTHTQTGVVLAASIAAYEEGRIRRHEFTRPDKEDDRVRQIDALNAQTGPVFLTYRQETTVAEIVARATAQASSVDVTMASAGSGIEVRHRLWAVADAAHIDALTRAFDAMPRLYIADGHHRSAAAARVAKLRREKNRAHTGSEPYNYFLAVAFPDTEMQILEYNRLIKDLNSHSAPQLMQKLGQKFSIEGSATPVKPTQAGEFGLYVAGRWARLRIRPDLVPDDPVRRLDASLLQEHVIAPLFGVSDPRRDQRIDFVGGIRGVGDLMRRVDSGDWAVALTLHPTPLSALMAVADAGEVMPPKSTWFEPKLADGLVSHSLD